MTGPDVFPGLRTEPGEIRLTGALKVLDKRRVKVWEVDLYSIHAEIMQYSHDDNDDPTILLCAGDRTHLLDKSRRGQPTRIALVGLGPHWPVLGRVSRSTLTLVAYQGSYPQDEI